MQDGQLIYIPAKMINVSKVVQESTLISVHARLDAEEAILQVPIMTVIIINVLKVNQVHSLHYQVVKVHAQHRLVDLIALADNV